MTVVNAMVLLLGIGLGAGALLLVGRLRRRRLAELESGAQATAVRIVEEARKEGDAIRKEARSQVADLVGRAKADAEREARDHRSELIALEKRVAQKEESLDRKIEMFGSRSARPSWASARTGSGRRRVRSRGAGRSASGSSMRSGRNSSRPPA